MVEDSEKTRHADTVKLLNAPEPVQVREASSGFPAAVKATVWQKVQVVEDRWRIDDEWWRSEPISRLYYAVVLVSGQRMVIYRDLILGVCPTKLSWHFHHWFRDRIWWGATAAIVGC